MILSWWHHQYLSKQYKLNRCLLQTLLSKRGGCNPCWNKVTAFYQIYLSYICHVITTFQTWLVSLTNLLGLAWQPQSLLKGSYCILSKSCDLAYTMSSLPLKAVWVWLLPPAKHTVEIWWSTLVEKELKHLIYTGILAKFELLIFFTNSSLLEFQIGLPTLYLHFSAVGSFYGKSWQKCPVNVDVHQGSNLAPTFSPLVKYLPEVICDIAMCWWYYLLL